MPSKNYDFMKPDYQERLKQNARRRYLKNREAILAKSKAYEKANPRPIYKNAHWHKRIAEERIITFKVLGNKCCKCGFADKRALHIDHVNSDGKLDKHRTSNRLKYLKHVVASYLANEFKYQLLCANCNWIKRYESNEHTPRKVRI